MNKIITSINTLLCRLKIARLLGKSFRSRDRGDLTSSIYYLEKVIELDEKCHDDVKYQVATEELFNHYMKQDNVTKAIDRGLLSLKILMNAEYCNLSFFEKLGVSRAPFLYELCAALEQHNPEHPEIQLLKTIISKYETSTN